MREVLNESVVTRHCYNTTNASVFLLLTSLLVRREGARGEGLLQYRNFG